jgi:L-type amino acid transporter 9
MVFVVILHGLTPRAGVYVMNLLSIFKIVILIFVVITGWVVLSGKTHITNPQANFTNAFAGSSRSSGDYATATFKVIYAYSGWSSVNYVLNNVRDPVRTLKIAGPLGLGICATLYILANIAYFSAATKAEIESSGVTVAALFFRNVFGTAAERALSAFVALSALGNVITSVFAAARVNQGKHTCMSSYAVRHGAWLHFKQSSPRRVFLSHLAAVSGRPIGPQGRHLYLRSSLI